MGYGGCQPLSSNPFFLFDSKGLHLDVLARAGGLVTSRLGLLFSRKRREFKALRSSAAALARGSPRPLSMLVAERLRLDDETELGKWVVLVGAADRITIDLERDDHSLVEAA